MLNLSFANIGTSELILLLIATSFIGLLPAVWGYYAGSKRTIGGGIGFLLGFLLSFLGVLIVYISSRKPDYTFYNFSNKSTADELQKLKHLLDSGAITEQEYTAQKAKVLNAI